jgi:hypothetical protein
MLVAAEAKREEEKAKGVSADEAADNKILSCLTTLRKRRKVRKKMKSMARNLKEGEEEEG